MQWSFYLVWQCWVPRIHEYNLSTDSLHIHYVQILYCCHLCYCLPVVCNTIMHRCWPSFSRHTPWCHTETCGWQLILWNKVCPICIYFKQPLCASHIRRQCDRVSYFLCQAAFTPSSTYTPLIPHGHKFCSNLPSIFGSYVMYCSTWCS
jgi:hypothetical protein